MNELTIAPVVCSRCGTTMTGQYRYLGSLGPLCGRCFGEEAAANRAEFQFVPAHGAETDCEGRIRELETEVERLTEHIRERERVWSERERVAIKEAKRLETKVERLELLVERLENFDPQLVESVRAALEEV